MSTPIALVTDSHLFSDAVRTAGLFPIVMALPFGDPDPELLAETIVAEIDRCRVPIVLCAMGREVAPALIAAARRPHAVAALVCCSGHPARAGDALARVRARTLFVVGSTDLDRLREHLVAGRRMDAKHDLVLVSGSRHPFAEPGALDEVSAICARWLVRQLGRPAYAVART